MQAQRQMQEQKQMQMQMWTGGLKRIYFVLYCPEVDPNNVVVLKYTRGIKYQADLERRSVKMLEYMKEVQEQHNKGEIVIETVEK